MRADLAPPRKYKRSETHYTLSKKLLYLSLVAFWGKNLLGGSEKSLSWQHCAHLNYSPLSLSLTAAAHVTHFQTHTHVQEYLDHGQSGGGGGRVPPFTIFDWFIPRYGPNVCKLLNNRETFRVAETFFSFLEWLVAQVRLRIFFSRTLEKLVAL